ncbi:hypothetical protein GA830_10390 [Mesorhizobium sp. NBSH29]|uniref:hypothetical protein n=1 Tax=Mesorhizobium sp. NBSH29 TaxID=2654249 RepID=UPI0018965C9B|nr:hypothetical protein [Mesorhizobium sp. NBSH29]QPC87103.1 hypothetical protein GA830_10390 [Mesorhizobium sp. NBSH29]
MVGLDYVPVDREASHIDEVRSVADKPASRPIAKALPIRDDSGEFYAQFALPGMVPMLVNEDSSGAGRYQSVKDAENAARKALFGILTSRTVDTRKAGAYKRITAADFAVSLDEANITPTYFAEIYGVPYARVMMWLDGAADVPHSAHVLVKLIATEENFVKARSITERAQDKE